jgi:hypothetical protein
MPNLPSTLCRCTKQRSEKTVGASWFFSVCNNNPWPDESYWGCSWKHGGDTPLVLSERLRFANQLMSLFLPAPVEVAALPGESGRTRQ